MQTLSSQSSQRSPHPHPTSSPYRIIAMGDSLIYGYGDVEGGGWVERLRRRWMLPDSPGHILYNLGIRGDGVQHVSRRLEAEFCNRGELRHRVPDVMILSVGTNDSARLGRSYGRNFTEPDVFEADLNHLLERASQLCQVFFVGMTPVDEAKMPFSNFLYYNHSDQHHYRTLTQAACQRHTIPYLDVLSLWLNRGDAWWRSRLSDDGLHPTADGYGALLQDFLAWDAVAAWAR
ncbi:MAG: GDSL-type esterase/lipase family protein [Elainellaceae cyanobacterium]